MRVQATVNSREEQRRVSTRTGQSSLNGQPFRIRGVLACSGIALGRLMLIVLSRS